LKSSSPGEGCSTGAPDSKQSLGRFRFCPSQQNRSCIACHGFRLP